MPVPEIAITLPLSHYPPEICPNCNGYGNYFDYRKDAENKVNLYRIECSWCGGHGHFASTPKRRK